MKIELNEDDSTRYILTIAHVTQCKSCRDCLGKFLKEQGITE
jgi:hypothetical protein